MGYLKRSACITFFVCIVAICIDADSTLSVEKTSGWAYELSDELMSPYCPGRALSECPSSAAEELRLWIIQQENSGMSRESVESALLTRYGDILLQTPKAEGVGLIAYVVPGGLFVVIGLVGLVFILRRRQIMAVDLGKINPEVSKKIDEDLLNRDLKI